MKKLTAGIFATLLAVVSTGAANAEIASKGYVDQQVDSVEATVAGKADSTTVTALDARVKTAEGEIDTLQTDMAGKADKATTLSGYGITDAYTSAQGAALAGRVSKVEAPTAEVAADVTGPVSGGTVYDAIQGVSGNVGTVTSEVATLKTDMTQAKEDISELQTDKQNKNMGAGAVNHVVITDQTGNITSAATIEAAKVSGLAEVATSGAYGDLTGTPSLGTLASKSTIVSADITDGTIAEADLNEAINESLGKADSAVQPSAITDMQVKSNLTDAARWNTDKSSDTKYPSNAAVNAAITSATSGLATDSKMGDLSDLTTTVKTNLVGAINEVDKNADDAKTAADTAQADATKALTDAATAQSAAEAAQRTAEAKQDKLTGTIGGSMQPVYLNDGTITAGTALGTLATKSKVTNSEVDDGALAQSKINGLATSLAAKLTTPPTSAKGEDGLYVLTYNGTDFQWEDIARTVAD